MSDRCYCREFYCADCIGKTCGKCLQNQRYPRGSFAECCRVCAPQYDPLAKADPDTTISSAKQRKKGGLGIFMVKKSMDNVNYEYKDGKNILTIMKIIN